MRLVLFIMLLVLLPGAVQARPIVADLAIRSIDIGHDFAGIDILLFGARNDIGDIVVVVRGPEQPYIVRKKERMAGVWVNRKAAEFSDVPGFYAVAAVRPLEVLKNEQLLRTLGIGMERLDLPSLQESDAMHPEFREALLRHKEGKGLYVSTLNKVDFWGETLFRTVLRFPKNIMKGLYTAEVYLFNDGQLTAMQFTPFQVSHSGFEAWLHTAAHQYSLLYGIAAVLIALLAGWVASVIFHR